MNDAKKKKLEEAGWAMGDAEDFLELSEAESAIVAMKLALGSELKALRRKNNLTQQEVAGRIGSSQSRVAKMENADELVSLELMISSLISLGASPSRIGRVIGSRNGKPDPASKPRRMMKTALSG